MGQIADGIRSMNDKNDKTPVYKIRTRESHVFLLTEGVLGECEASYPSLRKAVRRVHWFNPCVHCHGEPCEIPGHKLSGPHQHQIVRCEDASSLDVVVVWPKEDVPVLDRLAAIL